MKEHQDKQQELKPIQEKTTGDCQAKKILSTILIGLNSHCKKNPSNIWKIARDLVFQPQILLLYLRDMTLEEVKFLVSKVLSKQSFPTELASSSFYLCC